MRKKILAGATTILLLLPFAASAITVNVPEDIISVNSILTAELQLAGKLKTFLDPLINNQLRQRIYEDADIQDRPKINVLLNKMLEGSRLVGSIANQTGLFVANVSNDEWNTLIERADRHTYNANDVYQYDDVYFSRLGEFATVGTMNAIHEAIDISTGSSTNSLATNQNYQEMIASFPSPRLFSAVFNIGALSTMLQNMISATSTSQTLPSPSEPPAPASGGLPPPQPQAMINLLSMIDMYGISVSDTPQGYRFYLKIKGNPERLTEENFSLNPGGAFTPNLYTKFPNAKPILYTESFNQKAEHAQAKRMLELMTGNSTNNENIYDIIRDKTAFDIEAFLDLFDKETGFAVQYDEISKMPFFTFMADVSSDKTAAETQLNNLINIIRTGLRRARLPRNAYQFSTTGSSTTKLQLDITRLPDFDGPAFDPLTITFSITDDNLLIISNYPDIDNPANRTGFAQDMDFSSALPEITVPNTGVVYFNARNLWTYVDSVIAWIESITNDNGVPLEFYQGYYGLLERIYSWKDLTMIVQGTTTEVIANGNIRLDQTTHKTYEQLVSEMRGNDTDSDGVNDYEERFWRVSSRSGDSDNDGLSDVEELQRGSNPEGEGRLFNDVPENSYYTRDVSFLRQRGAISGYNDRSFQPGRLVNRAEFTAMVVKAFEQNASDVLGINMEILEGQSRFIDVNPREWYYRPIAKAENAGLISGSADSFGRPVFRPGDPITRAEALAILNKASTFLARTGQTASCAQTPFNDVSPDDWFCNAVANGYANGITAGKRPDAFKPFDYLNRAEAAVMIRRALERDLNSELAE